MKPNKELSKHCQLCDHKLFNITEGTKCGLTNEYPNFKNKCSNILLNEECDAKIKEINIDVFKTNGKKNLAYLNLVVFLIVTVAVFYYSIFLELVALEKGVFAFLPVFIFISGLGFLGLAFKPLLSYRQEKKVNDKKKKDLDATMALYNKEYDIDITFDKDVHGNKTYHSEIKMY
ncbi:hypothetical protein KMW28_15170 [Flammeovirga yaeyamensis]|uniref:Uncharacterized protein n=1 Tax=Flammeovirga yaeyamensis TaxID=367791 RepID=A0AAX1N0G3_9BACT|nr:hypothetical protein [Flammeovirga yaeyamensis]MBB3698651.1 hypothetical protein [Flammeovirga yaeyamensis]NMF34003.1 hypothetical protein [Flammeovirga yaeyamensis]QWG00991.1 hypothetical protein KMW28_15170 [Flammeovirga yaeyamensis]